MEPKDLPRSFQAFHKFFGYFLQASPYLFIGGLICMLLGNIFLGEWAWNLIYLVTVFPVISMWLMGTGSLIVWSTLVCRPADRDRVLSSIDGIIWFLAGWMLAAGGLYFFVMGIRNW